MTFEIHVVLCANRRVRIEVHPGWFGTASIAGCCGNRPRVWIIRIVDGPGISAERTGLITIRKRGWNCRRLGYNLTLLWNYCHNHWSQSMWQNKHHHYWIWTCGFCDAAEVPPNKGNGIGWKRPVPWSWYIAGNIRECYRIPKTGIIIANIEISYRRAGDRDATNSCSPACPGHRNIRMKNECKASVGLFAIIVPGLVVPQ